MKFHIILLVSGLCVLVPTLVLGQALNQVQFLSGSQSEILGNTTATLDITTKATDGGAIHLRSRSTGLGLYISTGNNIGIGTSDPGGVLDVLFSTASGNRHFKTYNTDGVRLQRTDDTAGWAYEYGFLSNNGTNLNGFGGYGNDTSLNYYYIGDYGGGELVTILSGGNVGIGTTSPSQKLHVEGDINLGTSDNIRWRNRSDEGIFEADYALTIQAPNEIIVNFDSNANDTTNYFRVIHDGSVEMLRVDETGVGVGKTPSVALDVSGSGSFTGTVTVATPTASGHAATKGYVDSTVAAGDFVSISGDTMTGALSINANANGNQQTWGTGGHYASFAVNGWSESAALLFNANHNDTGDGFVLAHTYYNTSCGTYNTGSAAIAYTGNGGGTLTFRTAACGTAGELISWTNNLNLSTSGATFYQAPTVNGSAIWYAGNDGSGSGLDADTLDGFDSSAFGRLSVENTWSARQNIHTLRIPSTSGATSGYMQSYYNAETSQLRFYPQNSAGSSISAPFGLGIYYNGTYYNAWHAGNDGLGSGLDADTLDGSDSSSFVAVSGDTMTGTLNMGGNKIISLGTPTSNADAATKAYVDSAVGGSVGDADTLDGLNSTQFLRSDTADTASGDITIDADLLFEGGYHQISYNDGNGNFNIRVGNDSSEIITEDGYPFHTEWSQTSGWIQWNIGVTGGKVGEPVSWDDTLQWSTGGILTVNGSVVWHQSNDGSGSGLDADLLDGYNAAESSTVSTVAVRNSSGDINARLFRSEYDTTNSSVNYIMTQVDTGTNNYIRPSTPAQVRAALGVADGADITSVTAGTGLSGGGTSGAVTINLDLASANTWTASQTVNVTAGDALFTNAVNNDVNIWRISYNGNYGYYQRYIGSGSGNDNALELWTEGQAGTDIQVYHIKQDGSIGIGTTSPASLLHVNGTITATKIDVGEVDPVYTIGDIQYATYAPSMTGVQEETTGVIQLTKENKLQYEIDFNSLAKASDLWLFYQVTDFDTAWSQLAVLLTPNFKGKVWYKKYPEENKLVIFGDEAGEVSFRLTAPRFDAADRDNYKVLETKTPYTSQGYILKEK